MANLKEPLAKGETMTSPLTWRRATALTGVSTATLHKWLHSGKLDMPITAKKILNAKAKYVAHPRNPFSMEAAAALIAARTGRSCSKQWVGHLQETGRLPPPGKLTRAAVEAYLEQLQATREPELAEPKEESDE